MLTDNLVEVGMMMRNFFDDDGLCPYCHAGAYHKSWCVVSLWDEAMLSIKIDTALQKNISTNKYAQCSPS